MANFVKCKDNLKYMESIKNESIDLRVAFRLNEGNVQIDTLDRIESLCKGMADKWLPYAELIGG